MGDTPVLSLLKHLADPMAEVDALILHHMRSDVALIPQIGEHLVASGGKRVRPLLTLAAAHLGGAPDSKAACQLAAAVEFIHTATLLHDDVVDGSDLRRGTATANQVWGNKAPVLVGDFLFSRAFELMVKVDRLDVLGVLSAASAKIAEGEVHQLRTTRDLATTVADYEAVIGAKTAALFAAATHVGALVSGAARDQVAALATYGANLGLAFQMADDALDYGAKSADMGKAAGDDFREGKVTLPVILAYAAGDAGERAFWHRTIRDLKQEDGDLDQATAFLDTRGTIQETLDRAAAAADTALGALDCIPASPLKSLLIDLGQFVVHRPH